MESNGVRAASILFAWSAQSHVRVSFEIPEYTCDELDSERLAHVQSDGAAQESAARVLRVYTSKLRGKRRNSDGAARSIFMPCAGSISQCWNSFRAKCFRPIGPVLSLSVETWPAKLRPFSRCFWWWSECGCYCPEASGSATKRTKTQEPETPQHAGNFGCVQNRQRMVYGA
jgi:hypothetical protein